MRSHSKSGKIRAEVKPLLKVEDVARRLGLSALTIYTWASLGKIRSCTVGRQLRFEYKAVEAMSEHVERGE